MQETIYDQFVDTLVTKAKQFVVGPGSSSDTAGGPLVSRAQFEKVLAFIDSGKEQGAHVAYGGERWSGRGYFVNPTSM